ncbi:MAG: pilus assembly protein [Propionibacteriaceae bacterium]|nr:pilus assembly protein [Propionibacteriaceae bacterium]
MGPDDVTTLREHLHQHLTPRIGNQRGERGSISLEVAIVVPTVLLVVFALIQAGLYLNTRNIAARAASTAAVNAAAWHATDADGRSAGQAILDQTLAEGQTSHIQIDRTTTQVVVTVTASTPTIMSGLGITSVSQSAAAPIERWTR